MKKKNMCDFVRGRCQALKETEQFISDWIATGGHPCSACGSNKLNCTYLKELVGEDASGGEPNEPMEYSDRHHRRLTQD
jgi:hypothetical protein